MTKFAELDDVICEFIAQNPGRSPIHGRGPFAAASDLLALQDDEKNRGKEWRLIDSRLQAMRKAGRIKYKRASLSGIGGWCVLAEAAKAA